MARAFLCRQINQNLRMAGPGLLSVGEKRGLTYGKKRVSFWGKIKRFLMQSNGQSRMP